MIIIPSGRFLDSDDDFKVHHDVAGWFKIEALKVDAHGRPIERSRRVLADWFPNLITNFGINLIGNTLGAANFCRVGSGNTTPQFTDTQLQAQLASTNTVNASAEVTGGTPPNYFHGRNWTFRFATGVAAGNISEVGVGSAATGATLFSRALILDGSLNPTTITVLSDEVLDVTYQSRWYPPTTDDVRNITITGVGTVQVTTRASSVTASTNYNLGTCGIREAPGAMGVFNGAMGTVTGSPSGGFSSSTSNVNNTYSANSLQRSWVTTFGLDSGNVAGGITSARYALGNISNSSCYGQMQCGFSPAIPKLNTQILTLNGTHSWARR